MPFIRRADLDSSDCSHSNSDSCEKPTSIPGWGIAITVVIPVLLFAGIIGAFIYRNYKKNKAEEAFDNDPDFDGDGTVLPDYHAGPYTREIGRGHTNAKAPQHQTNANPFDSGSSMGYGPNHDQTYMYSNNPTTYANDHGTTAYATNLAHRAPYNNHTGTLYANGSSVKESNTDLASNASHSQHGPSDIFALPFSNETESMRSLDDYARHLGPQNNAYSIVKSSSQQSLALPNRQGGANRQSTQSALSRDAMLEYEAAPNTQGRFLATNPAHIQSKLSVARLLSDYEDASLLPHSNSIVSRETLKAESPDALMTAFSVPPVVKPYVASRGRDQSELVQHERDFNDRAEPELYRQTVPWTEPENPDVQSPELFSDNRQSFMPNDESNFTFGHELQNDRISEEIQSDTAATTARGSSFDGENEKGVGGSRLDFGVEQSKENLSPSEEEELKRIKSVYNVYFERGNSIASRKTAAETLREGEQDESRLPPLPNSVPQYLMVDTMDHRRDTVVSSVYSLQDGAHHQHGEGHFGQTAKPPFHGFNPQVHPHYAEAAQLFEAPVVPMEKLPELQLLPLPADLRKSTLETFTNFLPKEREGNGRPKLSIQPYNPIEHADVWSPASPNLSELPSAHTMSLSSGSLLEKQQLQPLPTPAQLARASISMTNSLEFGQKKTHKPAGAMAGRRPHSPVTTGMDSVRGPFKPELPAPINSLAGNAGIPSSGSNLDLRKALGSNPDYDF